MQPQQKSIWFSPSMMPMIFAKAKSWSLRQVEPRANGFWFLNLGRCEYLRNESGFQKNPGSDTWMPLRVRDDVSTSLRMLLAPRRVIHFVLVLVVSQVYAQSDPLPSWNDGPAKKAIIEFIKKTTETGSPNFVRSEARIATFDQDGTTWVEQPVSTQLVYYLERVPAVAEKRPELKTIEPFKTVLSGNRQAMARFTTRDIQMILAASLTGITVEEFKNEVKQWLATAKHPRFDRPYTDLTYEPMVELMKLFRSNGYKTYFVTGGGQDFVRTYSERTYGIPPEQVVASVAGIKYGYDKTGRPILTKEPRLLFDDHGAGKPEAIHLAIGRRPYAAFGNSTGDKEMLEYTSAGDGARLAVLVLHDDARREYAYGPAQQLPDTKVGIFSQALYDEAKHKGWIVISMKNDWKHIFSFE